LPAIREEINVRYALRRGNPTKPYSAKETDAAKKATYDPTTTDIWKFRHLPKADQESLIEKMTPEERDRYEPRSALSELAK
jgi:hypothetical protein